MRDECLVRKRLSLTPGDQQVKVESTRTSTIIGAFVTIGRARSGTSSIGDLSLFVNFLQRSRSPNDLLVLLMCVSRTPLSLVDEAEEIRRIRRSLRAGSLSFRLEPCRFEKPIRG